MPFNTTGYPLCLQPRLTGTHSLLFHLKAEKLLIIQILSNVADDSTQFFINFIALHINLSAQSAFINRKRLVSALKAHKSISHRKK